MADTNDWRAERAAQLAGTPFARPAATSRLEDTLPIDSAWVSPKPAARPVLQPRRGPMYGVIAVAAALIAAIVGFLIVRHDRREDIPAPVASVPVAPVRAPAAPVVVPVPPAAVPSAPIVMAPAAPPVVAPVAEEPRVPVVRERKLRASPAAKSTAAKAAPVKRQVKRRQPARGATSVRKTTPTGTQSAVVIDDTPDVRPAPRRATRPPVCQPGVYSRAARPCQPSHDRFVRKPYYAK